MEKYELGKMIGGWFIGDFEPSVRQVVGFEVGYKKHPKGEEWPEHYHRQATEVNLLVRGSMMVNGELISEGEIFVLNPGETVKPAFLEDCELVVVKFPSVKGDKYEVI